jgi:hypothetical protein
MIPSALELIIFVPLLVTLALGLTTVLVIRQIARGDAKRMKRASDLEGRTKPVDVLAFRNLMDPDQDQFLRTSLPAPEYRRLKRMRNGTAVSYVLTVYENAATLIRLGEALQRQPATFEDGLRIVDLALKNRISAALLLVKLGIGWLSPGRDLNADVLTAEYSQLRENIVGILRRTMPLKSNQLIASL